MSTLVIKNLPENLHEKLRAQAARNHRSVTKEVVTLIESAVASKRPTVDSPQSFKLKGGGGLTIDELEAAIADDHYSHYKSPDELNRYMDDLRADREEVQR